MLVSIFHPYSFGVNIFCFFYEAALVANMGERLVFVLNTELMLKLATAVTH